MNIRGIFYAVVLLLVSICGGTLAYVCRDGAAPAVYVFAPSLLCTLAIVHLVIVRKFKGLKDPSVARFAKPLAIIMSVYGVLASVVLTLILSEHLTGSLSAPRLEWDPTTSFTAVWLMLFAYLHCVTLVHTLLLSNPHIRPTAYLWTVAWPTAVFFSSLLFGTVFLPFTPLAGSRLLLVPLVLSFWGLYESVHRPKHWETVRMRAGGRPDDEPAPSLVRWGPLPADADAEDGGPRSLRIVQITDPHIGPFMPTQLLRSMCEDIATRIEPDLVLITGDLFTPEGDHTKGSLEAALGPLKALEGRTFACFGNHDVESKRVERVTRKGLAACGVRLLVDEAVDVQTRCGKVKVIGLNWRGFGTTAQHYADLFEHKKDEFGPREDIVTRVCMLHNPWHFHLLPVDAGITVFSGHSHGGMFGFVSCGCNWTFLGCLMGASQGCFHYGRNTLYVHRGQGFRSLMSNFIVRLGVPHEKSILELKF